MSWSPLLNKDEKKEALDFGASFGSKKVNMAPGYLNLDVMCRSLAKAIMKHLEYSKGKYLFVDELKKNSDDMEFTYNFKKELKLSPSGRQQYETPKPKDCDILS